MTKEEGAQERADLRAFGLANYPYVPVLMPLQHHQPATRGAIRTWRSTPTIRQTNVEWLRFCGQCSNRFLSQKDQNSAPGFQPQDKLTIGPRPHQALQNRARARPRARKVGLVWQMLGVLRQVGIAPA